ncbi:TIGR04076 family protein [Chloroflexota bacterium]
MASKVYDIKVKVLSQEGNCVCGHKVGDEWILGLTSPEKPMCLPALDVVFSSAKMLRYGGAFPWSTDPGVTTCPCPDAENPVIFEIRRIED